MNDNICSKCGKANPAAALICGKCGAQLSNVGERATYTPPAPAKEKFDLSTRRWLAGPLLLLMSLGGMIFSRYLARTTGSYSLKMIALIPLVALLGLDIIIFGTTPRTPDGGYILGTHSKVMMGVGIVLGLGLMLAMMMSPKLVSALPF